MARVLLVDDNTTNLRMMGHTLRKSGHTLVTALHGGLALERLAEEPFDLVITDLTMPEMDGLELLRRIRADEGLRHLPVVVLTASGQDEDRETARAAGVSAFLTKPASSRELVETVGRLLAGAGG